MCPGAARTGLRLAAPRRIIEISRMSLERRFIPLLIALGASLVVYPLMVELDLLRLFRVVFVGFLAVAAYAISGARGRPILTLALAVPAVVVQLLVVAFPDGGTRLAATIFALIFLVLVIWVVSRSVLEGGRVTGDKIAGAVCVYLLLGLAWALVYGLIAQLQPGSFELPAGPGGVAPSAGDEYSFIYFSFVTLTTLGYGDITPTSLFARSFAWMEALTGQLYLAILIGRLVALQIIHAGDGAAGTDQDR